MGRMKSLAIALRNGDSLSDLSEAERDYVSGLTPEEYAAARGHDNSYNDYQEWQYHEKLRKELEAAKGDIAKNEMRIGTDLHKKLNDAAKG